MKIKVIKSGLRAGREYVPVGTILNVEGTIPWIWRGLYAIVAKDAAKEAVAVTNPAKQPAKEAKDPAKAGEGPAVVPEPTVAQTVEPAKAPAAKEKAK